MTPLLIEEDKPFQYNFAAWGIIPGARIKGYIRSEKYGEDVSGVVVRVYPKFVVIRKKTGMATTIHMGHLIGRGVDFRVLSRKKEVI